VSLPGLASGAVVVASGQPLGSCVVSLAPEKLNMTWRLYQVTVTTGSPTDVPSVATVYLAINGIAITDKVTSVTPVTAAGDPYIDIGPHQTLTAVVSDISRGIQPQVTVSYVYDELAGGM